MTDDGGPAFDLRFEDRDAYLYAFVSGPRDAAEVTLGYWQEIVAECGRRNADKILVEEDFPNQLSATEIYTVMRSVAAVLPVGLQVAFVDRWAEHDDLNMFAETVAVNRGVHGRVFSTVDAASMWLTRAQSQGS
jgi:hypothetical protein